MDPVEILTKLVEVAVTGGLQELDQKVTRNIKALCKRSSVSLRITYELLILQLKKPHAQIRFSCVQLVDILFNRSHLFRILLLSNFPEFLQLCLGIHQRRLPPPKDWASKLRQLSITIIKNWNNRFGKFYKHLNLGYHYLQDNLGISFSDSDIHFQRSSSQVDREARIREIRKRQYIETTGAINEQYGDIEENLQNMRSCFEILVPNLSHDVNRSSSKNDLNYQQMIKTHGFGSSKYQLTISVSSNPSTFIHETNENKPLYDSLREAYRMLIKHLEMVRSWIEILTKVSGELDLQERRIQQSNMQKLVAIRQQILNSKLKAEDLGINMQTAARAENFIDDDEDDEFEEVSVELNNDLREKGKAPQIEKESFSLSTLSISSSSKKSKEKSRKLQASVVTNLGSSSRIFSESITGEFMRDLKKPITADDKGNNTEEEKEDPEDEILTLMGNEQNEERLALLKQAPKVEWGEDLYYWDKTEVPFNTGGIEYSHRFLGTVNEARNLSSTTLEELKKRSVYVMPEIPRNIMPCRAKLPSGRLCPRRDLEKCPLHGKIIPRDDDGNPINPTNEMSVGTSQGTSNTVEESIPNWTSIVADVKANLNLSEIKSKKSKRERAKDLVLVDVKKPKTSAMIRIAKRLEDPKRKSRVKNAVDLEENARTRDREAFHW